MTDGSHRILVTGASGFLGRAIVAAGAQAGHHMIAVSRSGSEVARAAAAQASGDLASGIDAVDFGGVDAVVNCAARVHVMRGDTGDAALKAHHVMNAQLPILLADAARDAGVRRFVQISSVAAIASSSAAREVISDTTTPRPSSPYGRAKLAADEALQAMSGEDFTTLSLRPPAIYGPGVGAWFAMLSRAARAGVPLPLTGIDNARSFAFLGNVADAALASVNSVQSGSFIVADSPPVSTAYLYRQMLAAYQKGDRTWSCPPLLLRFGARMVLGDRVQSLIGNAAFDGTRFAQALNWQPRVTMEEGLRRTLSVGERMEP